MAEALISILIPVYNGESFLAEAIESVLNQSHSTLELILLDDGSSDNSLSIMRRFEKIDARVRVYSRENKGLVVTLNEGVALARGDYIGRMDADDVCRAGRLRAQLKFLIENDLDIVGGGINRFGRGKAKIKIYPETDAEVKSSIMTWRDSFAHPTILVKREIIEKIPYQQDFQGVEDMHLWMKMTLGQKIKMGNIQEVVLDYRRHIDQSTRKKGKDWYAHSRIRAMYDALLRAGCEFTEKEVSSFYEAIRSDEKLTSTNATYVESFLRKIISTSCLEEAVKRKIKTKLLVSIKNPTSLAGLASFIRLVMA